MREEVGTRDPLKSSTNHIQYSAFWYIGELEISRRVAKERICNKGPRKYSNNGAIFVDV